VYKGGSQVFRLHLLMIRTPFKWQNGVLCHFFFGSGVKQFGSRPEPKKLIFPLLKGFIEVCEIHSEIFRFIFFMVQTPLKEEKRCIKQRFSARASSHLAQGLSQKKSHETDFFPFERGCMCIKVISHIFASIFSKDFSPF